MAKLRPSRQASNETFEQAHLWLPVEHDTNCSPAPGPTSSGHPAKFEARNRHVIAMDVPVSGPAALRIRAEAFCQLSLDWLSIQIERERRERTGFLWLPVLLGTGSVIYFTLPREPANFVFAFLAILFLMLCIVTRHRVVIYSLNLALLFIFCGIVSAQLRVALLSTPTLSKSHITEISGTVIQREIRADGRVRYRLQVDSQNQNELLGRQRTKPLILRITTRKGGTRFKAGDKIAGLARVGPAPGPAIPGGYDFAFNAWFGGLGGSGFFLGHPELQMGDAQPTQVKPDAILQVRDKIASDLRLGLPGQSGAIAAALIVGDRSGIDDPTNEALRRAGLAHILAISGLHMALVALNILLIVRLGLVLLPGLVLNWPVKKIAGLFALCGASFYLLLSGASISTQRAYMMIAIMLIALLLDRRALTMRNVALSALIILMLAPESVLQPGFQMSFSATAGLIAAYGALRHGRSNRAQTKKAQWSVTHKAGIAVFGLFFTPIVAGGSTALFAAYHFYQVAPLGAVANAMAMPVVAFVVMPLSLLAVLAMPLGLIDLVLAPLGASIDLVVGIAKWVAQLQFASAGQVGAVSSTAMIFGSLALIIAVLSRSKLRFAAIALAFLAIFEMSSTRKPLLVIAESGRQIGVLLDSGEMLLLKPNSEKFITGIWSKAYKANLAGPGKGTTKQPEWICDALGCVLKTQGMTISHVSNTAHIATDCVLADIIVIPYESPWACNNLPKAKRPVIIDRLQLERYGSHVIRTNSEVVSSRNAHTSDGLKSVLSRIQIKHSRPKQDRAWLEWRN
ncbi:MAG: ComEC/Rec2 family competence protein [Rhizobiaceae bacterium]